MSVLTMPDRSLEQRYAALKLANEVRCYRARLKLDLAAGRVKWHDLLDDPMCRSMKVVDAILCLPKVGRVKAHAAMRRAEVSPSKTLGGMTYRQRDSLKVQLP